MAALHPFLCWVIKRGLCFRDFSRSRELLLCKNTSIVMKLCTQIETKDCSCILYCIIKGLCNFNKIPWFANLNFYRVIFIPNKLDTVNSFVCFHRIWHFFVGLKVVAGGRSLIGFSKRAFRRGQRGWDLKDSRKGLVGKGSEYGQPFWLQWPLSIHPQGMGVSTKHTMHFISAFCVVIIVL